MTQPGALNYKMKTVNGKFGLAHRHIYEQAHGPIPEGMHIHHIDGDKRNNALENLVALTPREHVRTHLAFLPLTAVCEVCGVEFEAPASQRGRVKTCSREHFRQLQRRIAQARGGRLTNKQVREIRDRVANGERQRVMCDEFGMSPTIICQIVHRKRYGNVA